MADCNSGYCACANRFTKTFVKRKCNLYIFAILYLYDLASLFCRYIVAVVSVTYVTCNIL